MKRKPYTRRKIGTAQQHQLFQVLLHMGQEAAAQLCVEYGVSRNYARSYAHMIGKSPTESRGHDNPKWALAIERGAVMA